MLTRQEVIEKAKADVAKMKQEHSDLFFIVKRKQKKVIAITRQGGWANGDHSLTSRKNAVSFSRSPLDNSFSIS